MAEEPLCAVCLEPCGGGHALPCSHVFHPGCIVSWFRRLNTTCPVCRHDEDEDEDEDVATSSSDEELAVEPPVHRVTEAELHRCLASELRRVRRRSCPPLLRRRVERYKRTKAELAAAQRRCREHARSAVGRFADLRRGARKLDSAVARAQQAYEASALPLLRGAGYERVRLRR